MGGRVLATIMYMRHEDGSHGHHPEQLTVGAQRRIDALDQFADLDFLSDAMPQPTPRAAKAVASPPTIA